MNDLGNCHSLYLSHVPKNMILLYIEQLKVENIHHPSSFQINDLKTKILDDEEINPSSLEIEDPIIITLLAMNEKKCSFQAVIDRINELSVPLYGNKSPRITKKENL